EDHWVEILRIFLDVYDGRLTPLLDFPVADEEVRKSMLRDRLGKFLAHFLEFKLQHARELRRRQLQQENQRSANFAGNSSSRSQAQLAQSSGGELSEETVTLLQSAIEVVVAVCLKCDQYQALYRNFFERLSSPKQRLFFLQALERWLLLEKNLVKELDPEVYSHLLQTYAARLQEEEAAATESFGKLQYPSPNQNLLDVPTFVRLLDNSATQSQMNQSSATIFTALPAHLKEDSFLNVRLGEDLQVDLFPSAFPAALHLTRLVISSR
ncbi:unnamed protein product, partial [Amoebophrya sp. A25]